MSSDKLIDFNDQARFVKFVGNEYGIILHEDENRRGTCELIFGGGQNNEIGIKRINLPLGRPSSITVFKRDLVREKEQGLQAELQAGLQVGPQAGTFFEHKNYDKKGFYEKVYRGHLIIQHPAEIKKGLSILVEQNFLIVLFEKTDGRGRCEVFINSDPNLDNNYITACGGIAGFWQVGCFTSFIAWPKR